MKTLIVAATILTMVPLMLVQAWQPPSRSVRWDIGVALSVWTSVSL